MQAVRPDRSASALRRAGAAGAQLGLEIDEGHEREPFGDVAERVIEAVDERLRGSRRSIYRQDKERP